MHYLQKKRQYIPIFTTIKTSFTYGHVEVTYKFAESYSDDRMGLKIKCKSSVSHTTCFILSILVKLALSFTSYLRRSVCVHACILCKIKTQGFKEKMIIHSYVTTEEIKVFS